MAESFPVLWKRETLVIAISSVNTKENTYKENLSKACNNPIAGKEKILKFVRNKTHTEKNKDTRMADLLSGTVEARKK